MDVNIFGQTYHDVHLSAITWEKTYDFFGIKDFVYFISSPSIQAMVLPAKFILICFSIFFLGAVIWFYRNSTYLQYKFLQDVTEFISKEPYGLRKINKGFKEIKKRIESGSEADLKLAIIEADDFLYETLVDMGYEGSSFEELVESASKKIFSHGEKVLSAHKIRNDIVYKSDYRLDSQKAKEILSMYEAAVKNIAVS